MLNTETTNMKLYTEEQVRQAMSKKLEFPNDDIEKFYSDDEIIESLTPIELPSNEEIEKFTDTMFYGEKKYFVKAGVLWIKNQILNQNK